MTPTLADLKKLIRNGNFVEFVRYHDGALWYLVTAIQYGDDGEGQLLELEFPVPVADIGSATFLASDKAILMMRYIRKHLETIDAARKDQNVDQR